MTYRVNPPENSRPRQLRVKTPFSEQTTSGAESQIPILLDLTIFSQGTHAIEATLEIGTKSIVDTCSVTVSIDQVRMSIEPVLATFLGKPPSAAVYSHTLVEAFRDIEFACQSKSYVLINRSVADLSRTPNNPAILSFTRELHKLAIPPGFLAVSSYMDLFNQNGSAIFFLIRPNELFSTGSGVTAFGRTLPLLAKPQLAAIPVEIEIPIEQ